MALNLQTLRTRTISALVFIAVMLAGVFIHQWTFFILFSVIHFGCWREYQRIVGLIDKGYQEITPVHRYGVIIAGWCLMLWYTTDVYTLFGFPLHEMGWWLGLMCVFILPITELLFTRNIRLKNISHSAFGLIYISLSLGLIMEFTDENIIPVHDDFYVVEFPVIPAFIIGCLWVNDTMAYIVGSLIGRTPLTKISPKKTWEGTIGGIVLAVGVAVLLMWLYFHDWGLCVCAGVAAAIIAITGTLGDILESKLKRLADVKDSGSMMPGHGGFLDRFDSLLVAIPFTWIYIQWIL